MAEASKPSLEQIQAKLAELPPEKLAEGIVSLSSLLGKAIGQMASISQGLSIGVDRGSLIRRLATLRAETATLHEEISDRLVIQEAKVIQ